jgi:uncharacterized damage-inducible protein DinB
MTSAADLVVDALDRVREGVHAVLDGLAAEHLTARVRPSANTIAWLVWHLTRVQDDHLAAAAGTEQLWTTEWAARLALALPRDATGYGADSDEVAAVTASAEQLRGYHDAVHEASVTWARGLTDADLTRVVDEDWDPPVTLAVRLVSVIEDDLQHVGQAAYVRGLLQA